jgi:cell division protein FtsL
MVHEGQQQTSMNKSARQTRELVRRVGKLTEAQAAMGWGVVLLIVTLVGAIYLNQSSEVAAVGRHVQELEYEYGQLQRENDDVKRDIAEAQSLERLQTEMERMGFVPASTYEIEYLVIPDYPEPAAPVSFTTEPDHPTRPVESIRDALKIIVQDQLDDLMRGESGE